MNLQDRINTIASFFTGTVADDNPISHRLSILQDYWDSVYSNNRKQGFSEAKLLANKAVIAMVLADDYT